MQITSSSSRSEPYPAQIPHELGKIVAPASSKTFIIPSSFAEF